MNKWIVSAVLSFLLAVTIPVVYTTWFVRSQLRHECASLELLTAKPPVPPVSGRPVSAEVYRFYVALQNWERADGC